MAQRQLRLEMSKASIQGLGFSGAPEAGRMLARLRQWPYKEAQRATIEEAIRNHRRVSLFRKLYRFVPRESSRFHLREILPATADTSLVGLWRWMRSDAGTHHSPPACGWSRVLRLQGDGRYSFWEEDSTGTYPISHGRFTTRRSEDQRKGRWVELRGLTQAGPDTFWYRLMGPDLLKLQQGNGRGVWRDIGARFTFLRETEKVPQSGSIGAYRWRPPRVCRYEPNSYYIELPAPLDRVRTNQFRQWDLSGSKRLVPQDYEYTNYQIPSGLIGDFDGDSLADVALYGYDEYRSSITCFLSNQGSPRATVAWGGPPSSERGPSRPRYFLKLCPAGQWFVDSSGNRSILATDAIYQASAGGDASVLYYVNGGWGRGRQP
jgi:hypothetical protein